MPRTAATCTVVQNAANSPIGGISQAGLIKNSPGLLNRPMRVLGHYAVVYLIDGAGQYQDAAGLQRDIVPGDAIFVFPDIPHRYGPGPHQTWSEIYLVFEGPVFDLWRSSKLLDPAHPILHLEPVDYWLDRFDSILGAPRQPGFSPPLLEVSRLQQVLAEALVGGPKAPAGPHEMHWIARACAWLESDLQRQQDIQALARKLGLSYDYFRKRFTQIVGQPPARYRAARVIDRACQLMQTGGLTDKQIAHELGFCDEFHFSRRFKQITGCCPRQYRRRLPWYG